MEIGLDKADGRLKPGMSAVSKIIIETVPERSEAADFDSVVVSIVRRHVEDLGEGAIRSKQSRHGKYVSITVTFQAQSQQQLDRLYTELCAHEQVLMVL